MKALFTILTATTASLIFAFTTLAAEGYGAKDKVGQKHQPQQQQKQGQVSQQDLISSDWLLGKTVYSPQAEELGNITNLIMDGRTGNIGYVTISTGGFFDLSDEKHVIPFKALNITEDRVSLNMDKNKLAQSPQWKQGLTVDEFNRESADFFGVSPVWQEDDPALFEERGGVFEKGGGIIENGKER